MQWQPSWKQIVLLSVTRLIFCKVRPPGDPSYPCALMHSHCKFQAGSAMTVARDALARWEAIQWRIKALETACAASQDLRLSFRWASIESRIAKLEVAVDLPHKPEKSCQAQPNAQPTLPTDASPTHQRLHEELRCRGISDWKFVRVPADYYDQPLEFRQACLSAASIHHLCKSIVCENTRAHPSTVHPTDPLDPFNWSNWKNSRYYLIIVQYTARLNFEKIKSLVHKFNEGKIGKQFFNMRLAPEDINDALTGYSHNAVSPIGTAVQLPIIMSHRITELQPDWFFMGGGEVDLKVGMSAKKFVEHYKPIVADITFE